MLRKLLEIIDQDGLFNPNELARRLDTSPELVIQMLLQLEHAGRIKSVPTCQSAECKDCPLSSGCQVNSPRMWSIKL